MAIHLCMKQGMLRWKHSRGNGENLLMNDKLLRETGSI